MLSHYIPLEAEMHHHIIHVNVLYFVTALFARWSQDGSYAVAPSALTTILAIAFSIP